MGAFFIIPSPGRETSRQRRLQGTQRKEESIGGRRKIDGGERWLGGRLGAKSGRLRNRVKKRHGVNGGFARICVCALLSVHMHLEPGGLRVMQRKGYVNGAGIGA